MWNLDIGGRLGERLGEYLVKKGRLTEGQIVEALKRQVIMGGRLGTNLIELGLITEDDLTSLLGNKLNIPVAHPTEIENIDPQILELITPELAERYNIIPIKKEKKILSLVMLNPLDLDVINEIGFITNSTIRPLIATEARIQYALEKYYNIPRRLRFISIIEEEKKKADIEEIEGNSKDKERGELDSLLIKTKEELAFAKDREEVITILLKTLSNLLDRILLLVIKKGKIIVWSSYIPEVKDEELKEIDISIDESSTFKEVIESKELYRGPLMTFASDQKLIKALGERFPQEVVIIPLIIKNQVAALIYGDNLISDRPIRDTLFLNKLALKASMALEVFILKNKILE
ncbi:MAG: hypothetical protein ACE5EA_10270 [Nitrospirota bacterium]